MSSWTWPKGCLAPARDPAARQRRQPRVGRRRHRDRPLRRGLARAPRPARRGLAAPLRPARRRRRPPDPDRLPGHAARPGAQPRGPDRAAPVGRQPHRRGRDGPTLEELRDLPIPLADGGEVTVGGIATLEPTRSPFFIQRLDRETQVKVKARFFTPEPEKNRELVKKAMESFVFPAGYSSGEWSRWGRTQRSNIEVLIDLGLCLLLVYAVMASLFESFLQPFAILATCLLGCVGAPWLMWWTGTTVDTTAMIGLFILIGIAVNNGIMLIDRAIQLRAAGMTRDAALAAAGADRLRPILMTAGTTVLGLVPMMIHHPTLAGVYYHAIALILVGGLASSTVMTLIFLPATYSLIDDLARAGRSVWRRVAR
ncbi:efflux RND transporter permease subunit [Nannocystis pusilla]|uniref:efflux RND transporter permease subunit n=1 Tax=Nannocystis pusilla TaxID=889268 RepID=UPI003B7775D2